jgi:hypothetical protein
MIGNTEKPCTFGEQERSAGSGGIAVRGTLNE